MMEVTTEEAFSGPTDYAGRIAKRKRTKRQRLQSPYHFGTASSPSNDDGSHDHVINNNNHTVVSTDVRDFSPTSSNEVEGMSTLGEEEDMANCLILLAQGHSKLPQKQAILQQDVADLKFNSKRYLEASTGTGGNKIGYYVYECKTCSRTFPSFQALGGHRASHKKPNKAATEEKKHRHQFGTSSDDEESAQFKGHIVTSSALSLQLSSRNVFFGSSFSNKHPKVHECSICGAEFASGQALGGHMRRHRTPAGTNIGLSQNVMTSDSEESPARARNNIVSLDLDLNLPAPDEDDHNDHKETQVSLSSKKQKQQEEQQENGSRLVFPVPALVDCHY